MIRKSGSGRRRQVDRRIPPRNRQELWIAGSA
jgi:hypothetical protein